MNKKRTFNLFLVLIVVVLVAVGSWIAGSTIQSPAEAAARTAPPTPSPILAAVEERVLTSHIVTRGTARFGSPHSVSLVPSALKAGAGIITTVPPRSTQLEEGDVLLTASGRPVFILQGEIPAFRDFVFGTSGGDVHQFEDALGRLGYDPGPVDGNYDEQTAAAVSEWYATAGWQPYGLTQDQLVEIRALEQELAVAINNRLAAEDMLAAAPLAVEAARANAEADNKAAAAALSVAGSGPELEAAQAAVLAAQLAGAMDIQATVDAQKEAEREVQMMVVFVDQLSSDLDLARRDAGVKVPIDEIVFIPDLPVRVEQLEVVVGDPAIGPVMTVTNNQLLIDSSLPLDEAPLARPGMRVTIDEPDLGVEASGVVERVADIPGTDGVDGFHIYLQILVDESSAVLEGFSLRLTIPIESTGGAVTVVPISALSLSADGTTRIQVDNNGALGFVEVEPGLSANGFVQVTPVDATLVPGQFVVIGYENNS